MNDREELRRRAVLFKHGAAKIYEQQGERADMWFFELYHFLDDVAIELLAKRVHERAKLRLLVDIVWNEATESTAVPSTNWADQLIDRAMTEGRPVPVPEGHNLKDAE